MHPIAQGEKEKRKGIGGKGREESETTKVRLKGSKI